MTIEPVATLPINEPVKQFDIASDKQISILEDLFTVGYARSEEYKLYEDDNGLEFCVQYRTLTPSELRDIAEVLGNYRSVPAQIWTEKIETLARAITFINKMPLILDTKDRKDYEDKNKTSLSSLEQARIILYEKIKSPFVINLLFEKYQDFSSSIANSFEEIKKKLNNPPVSK
jgi:hypothetical protein